MALDVRRSVFLVLVLWGASLAVALGQTAPAPDFPTPAPATAKRVSSLIESIRQADGTPEREQLVADLVDEGAPAIPLILAELDRRSPKTWAVMIYALGASGDPRVIPRLRRELTRQTGLVYMEVLYALTLAGDPDAPLQALRSADATLAISADAPETTAMDFIAGVLGPAAAPMLIREIPRRSQTARIAGLGALGTIADASATPFLLEWSRQPNPVDRRHALIALSRIGDPRAGPRLVEAIRDPDESVREAAVEGVGYLREAKALPLLQEILRQPSSPPLRQRALWSFGLIGGPTAAAALSAALAASSSEAERSLIVQALAQTRDPAAVPALSREALGASFTGAAAAARALASVPGGEGQESLLAVCSDAPVHEAALEAARELMRRRDPRATPCTLKRLADEVDRRHGLDPTAEELLAELPFAAPASAAPSLESMAERIAAPALQHRLRQAAHRTRLVHETAAAASAWMTLLDEGDAGEVDLAIQRLADLGDPQAVEPLVRLFGRIEPDRAWRIPEALGRIGSERATMFLISLLTDDLYRVPSLVRAREEAARALARYARSPHAAEAAKKAFLDERGRLFTPLMAYARMKGPDSIPDLLELKRQLMRRRSSEQVRRHEKVNWAIRALRSGREIPLEQVADVD